MFKQLDEILTKYGNRASWAITKDGLVIKVDGKVTFIKP